MTTATPTPTIAHSPFASVHGTHLQGYAVIDVVKFAHEIGAVFERDEPREGPRAARLTLKVDGRPVVVYGFGLDAAGPTRVRIGARRDTEARALCAAAGVDFTPWG